MCEYAFPCCKRITRAVNHRRATRKPDLGMSPKKGDKSSSSPPSPGSFSLVCLKTAQRFVFPFFSNADYSDAHAVSGLCTTCIQGFLPAATYGGAITYGMDDCGGALPNWAIYDLGLAIAWGLRWRYGFFSVLPRTFVAKSVYRYLYVAIWDLQWVMIL